MEAEVLSERSQEKRVIDAGERWWMKCWLWEICSSKRSTCVSENRIVSVGSKWKICQTSSRRIQGLSAFWKHKISTIEINISLTMLPETNNILGSNINRLRRWLIKGGLSILDQGIYSGANFVISIMLARWLSYTEYGVFAIAMAVYMFFFQIHKSFIQDPMSVLATSTYKSRLKGYLIDQVKLHFIVMLPLGVFFSLALLVYSMFAGNIIVIRTLIVLGLTMPFMLLPWLLRRAFYVLQRPGEAVAGSVGYAICLMILLLYASQQRLLSVELSFLSFGLSGVFCSLFLFWRLYVPTESLNISQIIKHNWAYGKWLLVSAILVAVASKAQIFITGEILGLEASGVLEAIQNYIKPMSLSVAAIGAIGLPVLSEEFGLGNIQELRRKAKIITFCLTAMATIYVIILFVYRVPLEHFVYKGKYAAYVDLIPLWGLVPLIISINFGAAYALQAIQKPHAVLIVVAVWTPVSLGLGILFTNWWGIWGATFSALAGYVVAVISFRILYWYWVDQVPSDKSEN